MLYNVESRHTSVFILTRETDEYERDLANISGTFSYTPTPTSKSIHLYRTEEAAFIMGMYEEDPEIFVQSLSYSHRTTYV